MLARSNDVHYKEKRKHTADNSTTETTPRKRPLSDAFKNLSLQNATIRTHARQVAEGAKSVGNDKTIHTTTTSRDKGSASTEQYDDTEMRDPSSWSPTHTIFINSLDDESDAEAYADEEARFMFTLPGSIDTTFAGSKGIPKGLLPKPTRSDQQLVLYRGPAEEIITKALEGRGSSSAKYEDVAEPIASMAVIEEQEEAMELD